MRQNTGWKRYRQKKLETATEKWARVVAETVVSKRDRKVVEKETEKWDRD